MTNARRMTALAILAVVITVSAAALPPQPFSNDAWQIGEKLVYQVKYGFFRAGTATFTVDPVQTVEGRRAQVFTSNILSAPGFFFRINDTARSYSDAASLYTLRYEKIEKSQNEQSTNITRYNHAARSAQRTEDGQLRNPISLTPYAIDVLAAIYYVRAQNLTVGRVIKFPVHDGKWDYTMEVTVRKLESIRVPAGTFDCLMVEPRLREPNGQIRRKGQMTLWMTNDSRHIPVQIRTQMAVGSLTVQLQQATGTLPAI